MNWSSKKKARAVAMVVVLLTAAPGSAQDPRTEITKLRREIDQLRVDLDAAVREIRILKASMRPANAEPEKGPVYRGLPARYWKEQLQDTDQHTRIEAVKAIGALAGKDKTLIPVLIDALKRDFEFGYQASTELGALGPDALPSVIEVAKDMSNRKARISAVYAMVRMGAKAKAAVPVLTKALDEKTDIGLLRATVYALAAIGPDAKEATPALVETLGETLKDIDIPEGKPSRFGTEPHSINNLVLGALVRINPDLDPELNRKKVSRSFGGAKKNGVPEEVRAEWQKINETLVKKYLKPKS